MPADVGSKSRKKKPATPARPANQFIIYRTSMKDAVRAENPGASNIEISRIIGAKWRAMGEDERAIWKEKQTLVRAAHEKAYPNYKYAPRATRSQKTDAGDAESGRARQPNKLQHTPEQEVRSNLESQSTQNSALEPSMSLQQAYQIGPYHLLEQMPGQMDDQVFDRMHLQVPGHLPQINEGRLNLTLDDILGGVPAPAPEKMNQQMVHQTLDRAYDRKSEYDQKPEQTPFADQYLPTMPRTPEVFDEHLDIANLLDLDVDPLA